MATLVPLDYEPAPWDEATSASPAITAPKGDTYKRPASTGALKLVPLDYEPEPWDEPEVTAPKGDTFKRPTATGAPKLVPLDYEPEPWEEPTPTTADKGAFIPEAGKAVAAGGVGAVGTILKGAGASRQETMTTRAQEEARAKALQEMGLTGTTVIADLPIERQKELRDKLVAATGTVALPDVTRDPFYQAGLSTEKWSQDQFKAAHDYEKSWTRKIGEGLGSTVPYLATAIAGPLGFVAGLEMGQMGSAGEAVDRAVKAGATKEQILEAVRYGGIPGVSEQLSADVLFSKIPLPAMGKMVTALGRIGAKALAEGGQEGLNQAMQNVIAKYVYKPDQDVMAGVVEAAGIGAIVGGGIGAAAPSTYASPAQAAPGAIPTAEDDAGISSPGGMGATPAPPPEGAPSAATEQADPKTAPYAPAGSGLDAIRPATTPSGGVTTLAPGEVDPDLAAAALSGDMRQPLQAGTAAAKTTGSIEPIVPRPASVQAAPLELSAAIARARGIPGSRQDTGDNVDPTTASALTEHSQAAPQGAPAVPIAGRPARAGEAQPSAITAPQPAAQARIGAPPAQGLPAPSAPLAAPLAAPSPAASGPADLSLEPLPDIDQGFAGAAISEPVRSAPAPQPARGPALTGPQVEAMREITTEIENAHRQQQPNLRAQRMDEDARAAFEFIQRQPPKTPRPVLMRGLRKHLAARVRQPAAESAAAPGRPTPIPQGAAPISESAAPISESAAPIRQGGPPPRPQEANYSGIASGAEEESSPSPDAQGDVAGGPARAGDVMAPPAAETRKLSAEESGETLERTVAQALGQDASTATEVRDPAAAGGGKGGGGKGKGRRPLPGSPQDKSTRILRRAAKAGLRQSLSGKSAKTRWFLRKWLSDSQLSDFNEHRFAWTDDIDQAIRTDANPMRQVAEARSRAAARREQLARVFAPVLDRLDRLRRADPETYEKFTQLMADSSALGLDPTKPRGQGDNVNLGSGYTDSGYQGRRAHPVFAAQYAELARGNPLVPKLWSDLQELFDQRRDLETKTRISALVRPLLDRNNERARAKGKPVPATSQAAADAIADRVMAGTLTAADKTALGPHVEMAVTALADSGRINGTYLPFVREGQFVVRWTEKMQLPQGATWATQPDGSISDDRFIGDHSTVNIFQKETAEDSAKPGASPNAGLIIRSIRAFRPGVGKPVYRDEVTDEAWEAAGPKASTRYEVHVQRDGMALYEDQKSADAGFALYSDEADNASLELHDPNDTSELLPSELEDIVAKATFQLRDTNQDDATVELLERSMRDAFAAITAANSSAARNLRRRNVSGAEQNLLKATDRYNDASAGSTAKMQFAADVDTGMRGMRSSDAEKSRTDRAGQLARQQVLREWSERVANPSDNYRVAGGAENAAQAALSASFLSRLADISAVIIDATQPYLVGLPRLVGQANPVRAGIELARAEKAISSHRVFGRGAMDTLRSGRETVSKAGAFIKRQAGNKTAEGVRLSRASHFDRIVESVKKEKDGADLAKMLDELADVGLLSRDSTLDIKPIDADAVTGLNRILEPLADLARQLRIAVDIRNQGMVAVASYRIARSDGKTHKQGVETARDMVRQSQFDSTFATSAPVFKARGVARFPLQFKRFSVQSMIGMTRMMQAVFHSKNMTAAQRKEWRRIFWAGNVVLLASAGTSGHPLAMIVGTAVQAMMFALGEPPKDWEEESELWLAKLFAQEFGLGEEGAHDLAATVMRGLPSALGPIDISKRIGMGELIVHGRPDTFDTKGITEWIGTQLMGAPGETAFSPVDAMGKLLKGEVGPAVELMTPKFVANVIRASRGGTTSKGERLQAEGYSPGEAIAKGLGFQPTREADLRREGQYIWSEKERRNAQRGRLRDDFDNATNYKAKHAAWLKIQQWNRGKEEDARITDESLKRRQKTLLKDQGEDLYGGRFKLDKTTRDIGEKARKLNPSDKPYRKRIIEYNF